MVDAASAPLRFGTAGLRGPVRDGPGGMNVGTVTRASWAVARVLRGHGHAGATVVVGHDARHGSVEFAAATAEVLAAQGYSVLRLPGPVPTPVVAFGVRRLGAAAGVMITASHNPATDNGYKVFVAGGMQIVPPVDGEIEAAMAAAPPVDTIGRRPVAPTDSALVERYIDAAAAVRRGTGGIRVALTPLHGVGGAVAVEALVRSGFTDIHAVAAQFGPNPDFPSVAFPNPEEPGATDALLELAADVRADIAIALDPDADRCAVGIPTRNGWRMLSGDETGWLLGDYLLAGRTAQQAAASVVASTVVSSRMLASIAAEYGARHVETLTGFKWLARADDGFPGCTLAYAYEEAIGHCVDPAAVRDKDGVSAAVLVCDLVAGLRARRLTVPDALDALAGRHGVHTGAAVTRRVGSADEAVAATARLREHPVGQLAGFPAQATDLAHADGLIYTGGDADTTVRVVVRPSGTEPKLKCYIEVRRPPGQDVHSARAVAEQLRDRLVEEVRAWFSGDRTGGRRHRPDRAR